jgi:hypothetical protein
MSASQAPSAPPRLVAGPQRPSQPRDAGSRGVEKVHLGVEVSRPDGGDILPPDEESCVDG